METGLQVHSPRLWDQPRPAETTLSVWSDPESWIVIQPESWNEWLSPDCKTCGITNTVIRLEAVTAARGADSTGWPLMSMYLFSLSLNLQKCLYSVFTLYLWATGCSLMTEHMFTISIRLQQQTVKKLPLCMSALSICGSTRYFGQAAESEGGEG